MNQREKNTLWLHFWFGLICIAVAAFVPLEVLGNPNYGGLALFKSETALAIIRGGLVLYAVHHLYLMIQIALDQRSKA